MVRQRPQFDRAGDGTLPAPRGTIRLSQDKRDFMARFQQSRQRPVGECGGAGED
jgi:hypothetical protein